MNNHTGDGKYFIKVDPVSEAVRLWLFNYDINGETLKQAHIAVLNQAIGPMIRDGGSLKLLGLASTTGDVAWDKQLGERRMHGVISHLRSHFGGKFGVTKELSLGKEMALAFGQAQLQGGTGDNQESAVWRGVVINAWNRNVPLVLPTGIDVPFGNPTWADSTSKIIDVVSWTLGFVDLIADFAEIAAITGVTGPGGLIVGAIGSIVGMPLMWAGADALANTNGQIQGAADAIQDMADQYSNSGLDWTPLSKWRPVQVPAPHLPNNPQPSASQQAWQAGQAIGCKNAATKVVDLEQTPKPITLPSGKHIRLSGRLWLRAVSKTFRDNAGVEVVIKPANEELAKRGKPPFPTY
jgi:hypothetical protein